MAQGNNYLAVFLSRPSSELLHWTNSEAAASPGNPAAQLQHSAKPIPKSGAAEMSAEHLPSTHPVVDADVAGEAGQAE